MRFGKEPLNYQLIKKCTFAILLALSWITIWKKIMKETEEF